VFITINDKIKKITSNQGEMKKGGVPVSVP